MLDKILKVPENPTMGKKFMGPKWVSLFFSLKMENGKMDKMGRNS